MPISQLELGGFLKLLMGCLVYFSVHVMYQLFLSFTIISLSGDKQPRFSLVALMVL